MACLKGVNFSSREYIEKKNKYKLFYITKEFLIQKSSVFRKLSPGGWGDCYYLGTTESAIDILKKNFLLPDHNYIKSGLPRNCNCRMTNEEEAVINTINKFPYIILYLPTFRNGNDGMDLSLISKEVQDELINKNILWIQKGHSADNKFGETNTNNINILSLSPNFDINVLYKYITLVITDYSSVMGDAVYFSKPVWFYVPDYNEYINGDRGFVAKPEELMCGPKFYNIVSLKRAISNIDKLDAKKHSEIYKYPYIKEKYWGENKTIAEIWSDILEHIN